MRVEIDQPRGHELPARVDALHGAVGRDARGHRRDLAEADADVAPGARLLHGIEHVAVGDDQVVPERGIGGVEAERRRLAGLREQDRRAAPGQSGRIARTAERAARRGRRRRELDESATREIHGVASSQGVAPGLPEPAGIVAQGPTLRKAGAVAGSAQPRGSRSRR